MKLSQNFKKSELQCKHCGEIKIDENLIYKLELLRQLLNEPITVNSGYRCKIHNKNVGGDANSLHMKGMAADIRSKNQTELIRLAEIVFLNGGIGKYKNFIHVDVGNKRRWKG